jgi:hypothetical protein
MPQDVAIDLTPLPPWAPNGRSLPLPANSPPIDILFAPSGAVLLSGANDKIVLWVRDVTQDANTPGDQWLVTVSARNGSVAAYQVGPYQGTPPVDPYYFARSGTPSGL